jgi:Domain of unknown function (DUF4440)
MNSAFLRLFVAVTAFALSVGLTGVVKLFRREESTIAPVTIWSWTEKRARVEYSPSNIDLNEWQLRQIYRQYGPAQTRHDRAFFEQVETEDFVLFLGGRHLSREDDIRWMESLPEDVVYESYPESIKMIGDRAMVHGRMEARYGDGQMNSWGFIDVWVRRGDTWRIQSTTSTD